MFARILPIYANLVALQQGMEIREKMIRSGFQYDVIVVNSLIDMYEKCGNIQMSYELFDKTQQ